MSGSVEGNSVMNWKEECLKYVAERDELKVKLQAQADLAAQKQVVIDTVLSAFELVIKPDTSEGTRGAMAVKAASDYCRRVKDLADLAAGLRAKAEAAVKAVGQCSLVTDNGDAIFGAFRQTRCMSHGHVLVPCPVGILREALNPQPHHDKLPRTHAYLSTEQQNQVSYPGNSGQPHHEGGEG